MAIVQAPTKARFFLTGEPAIAARFWTLARLAGTKVANFSCPAAFSKRVQCKMNAGHPWKLHNINVLRRKSGTKRGQKAAPGTGIWPWPFPY
jgi:hypothetical protein